MEVHESKLQVSMAPIDLFRDAVPGPVPKCVFVSESLSMAVSRWLLSPSSSVVMYAATFLL